MRYQLADLYRRLYKRFGPQHWWPAETSFEVMVGAILTQNTNWSNVEKALENLRKRNLLQPLRLYRLSRRQLAPLIRPSGYYNIKAKRLKDFLIYLMKSYGGNIKRMAKEDLHKLRKELLSVKGIGPETADSILLYALDKPIFVIDAYTKRALLRHGLVKEGASYEEIQSLFMRNIKKDIKLYNEYHALLVRLGKDFCLSLKPRCNICPLGQAQEQSKLKKED